MNFKHPPLRWGILSTARIGRRNWTAMRESGVAELVAVASRDHAKAGEFIAEMQRVSPWESCPEALGSYEELLARKDIDAVYIPLPTAIRKEWVMRAAQHGKHVLCEKPCALNAKDLREMIASCDKHHVVFMDGVVFMHDTRFDRLRQILDDGSTIGEVKRITSEFSFRAGEEFVANDIRGASGLEPAGCLGDLGWYCIRASLWAMAWQMPIWVSGRVLEQEGNVIMAFSAEMGFSGGATASFHCSFRSPNQRWLHVGGTMGGLRVPDFIAPVADNDCDWEINYQRVPRQPVSEMVHVARMFTDFTSTVRGDGRAGFWTDIALKTQVVQDACELSSQSGKPVYL